METLLVQDIEEAKRKLSIFYGHTSHGSQLTTGMTGLVTYANAGAFSGRFGSNLLAYNADGSNGALHLTEYGSDAGYFPEWYDATVTALGTPYNGNYNVVIWSWCGQLSGLTDDALLNDYLLPMQTLESNYPNVKFVYMTGHSDGSGLTGNLHMRNEEIRQWCSDRRKILYDFNDIESYDPDGVYYGYKFVTDSCGYRENGQNRNWATEWQAAHQGQWFDCGSAHSQPLNANMKAYAAWHLWVYLGSIISAN
jgi:hypothetical protein